MATIDLTVKLKTTDTQSDVIEQVWTKSFASLTEISRHSYSLANNGTITIYNAAGTSPVELANWDFLLIVADQNIDVEFTNKPSSGDTEYSVVQAFAGVPLILGSDDTYGNYSTDVFAGTGGVIDKIRLDNNATGSTATILVIMAT